MRRSISPRRGAVLVEFGLLLLPLMMMLLGIIDYGFTYYATLQLTTAAREGARAEATGGDGDTAARQYLQGAGLTRSASVDISRAGGDVAVQITYDFEPLVGFVPTPESLDSRVVMRIEGGS